MRKLKSITCLLAAMTFVCVSALLAAEGPEQPVEVKPVVEVPAEADQPLVQMAILLDTSGSMSGLIDQARTELWSIVNEFVFARRNGRRPELQVALYEYGKSALPAEAGYIRQIVPLTTDLDKISEELFALSTNGGDEYCGWVIREAAKGLQWSDSADDLKVIFIAGNEPFTQGPVGYKEACGAAAAKGIIINTIHCGSEQDGINGKWKDGAVLADGRYLCIDHNRQVVHVAAPQDSEIAELGARLNETYIAFGIEGGAARERQAEQDKNARDASAEAAVQRAVTKSSANYSNTGWDLVDAVQAEQIDLDKVKRENLPKNMQSMTTQERKAYVESQAQQRTEIQTRIQQLNEQRKAYVAEEMKKQQGKGQTLGSVIQQAVRTQAQKKDYTLESADNSSSGSADDSKQ